MAPVIIGQESFIPMASQTVLAVPSLSSTEGQEDWRVQLRGGGGYDLIHSDAMPILYDSRMTLYMYVFAVFAFFFTPHRKVYMICHFTEIEILEFWPKTMQ